MLWPAQRARVRRRQGRVQRPPERPARAGRQVARPEAIHRRDRPRATHRRPAAALALVDLTAPHPRSAPARAAVPSPAAHRPTAAIPAAKGVRASRETASWAQNVRAPSRGLSSQGYQSCSSPMGVESPAAIQHRGTRPQSRWSAGTAWPPNVEHVERAQPMLHTRSRCPVPPPDPQIGHARARYVWAAAQLGSRRPSHAYCRLDAQLPIGPVRPANRSRCAVVVLSASWKIAANKSGIRWPAKKPGGIIWPASAIAAAPRRASSAARNDAWRSNCTVQTRA